MLHRRAILALASLAALAAPAVTQGQSDRISRREIVQAYYPDDGYVPASGEVQAIDGVGGPGYDGILMVRDNLNGYANSWRVTYQSEGEGPLGYHMLYYGVNHREDRVDYVVLWYDSGGNLYLVQAGDLFWYVI